MGGENILYIQRRALKYKGILKITRITRMLALPTFFLLLGRALAFGKDEEKQIYLYVYI